MAYLTQTQSGQPVLIMKEGTSRSRGREAQRNNIMAARVIAEAVRSTLGPRGMDKMLVDSLGDITVTNDGAAILDGFINLDRLYSKGEGRSIYEPDQFPALIYRWENPEVALLIFSTGKIVCTGAKKEGEIYEAVIKLQRRLEESEVLIKS